MSLLEKLTADQQAARRSHDEATLGTLQLVLAALKNERITLGRELTDADGEQIIRRQVKQLRDANQDFVRAGRTDLSGKTEQEIKVLEAYLPQALSEAELSAIVDEVLGQAGPNPNIGQLTGQVMAKVKGRADGAQVRNLLSKRLT